MMYAPSSQDAINHFRTIRRWSALGELLAWLTEKSINLLPFDGLSAKVQERYRSSARVENIPLEAIVILPGQYTDFAGIAHPVMGTAFTQKTGEGAGQTGPTPPRVCVYRSQRTYYLTSGRQDVVTARDQDLPTIKACVFELDRGIREDQDPEEQVLAQEWSEFLQNTHFNSVYPEGVLKLSFLGMYRTLEEHIAVHGHYLHLESKRDITDFEAIKHWYEAIYTPVIQAIEEHGILHEFQGLTETDLYLWVADSRLSLQKEIGWSLRPPAVTGSIANQMSPRLSQVVSRVRERIPEGLIPALPLTLQELDGQPPADDCLVRTILVPLSGHTTSWVALQQAIFIAQKEGSTLNGLHVLKSDEGMDHPNVKAMVARFMETCTASKVTATMSLAAGDISKEIRDHSKLADLIVVNLAHPPSPETMNRIGDGFRAMIKRCGRPVLAVPGQAQPVDQLLLAYDGSYKGNEALFLSAYLSIKWGVPLYVLTVVEKGRSAGVAQEIARRYLTGHSVTATYLAYEGDVVDIFLNVAHAQRSSLLIIGGYSFSPVVDSVSGSTVDKVLRKADLPVLICE